MLFSEYLRSMHLIYFYLYTHVIDIIYFSTGAECVMMNLSMNCLTLKICTNLDPGYLIVLLLRHITDLVLNVY